jgi:cytochrome c-type biogenesis protein CcmH
MRRWFALLAIAGALLAGSPASAVEPDEVLADPGLEARARDLSAELRCMVCQNQSIDDSNAPLAKDLRVLLRERISAGDSDEQVMTFLVARYGDFILLRPRFAPYTLVLWLTPILMLGLGAFAAFAVLRRRPRPEASLTEAERQRLDRILKEDTQ